MANNSALVVGKKSPKKLTRQSKIFKTIIKAILEKKGINILSLDMRKIPEASADFFIICEANNPIQLKSIAENVEEIVKKETGELPYKHEGFQALKWILIDFVNIVVHIMLPETRKFYQIEDVWHDAPTMEHT